jgi:hypothetical protein
MKSGIAIAESLFNVKKYCINENSYILITMSNQNGKCIESALSESFRPLVRFFLIELSQ